jgi:hypothetical protein
MKWAARLACAAYAGFMFSDIGARAADWTIAGTVLTPDGIVADGALAISDGTISAVGPSASVRGAADAVKVPGIILPGFIDLHDHLTWNVLPRWLPGRKFNNRYEWQDTAEYDRVLSNPHTILLGAASCETEIYAEIKALAGGATSVVGGLLKDKRFPDNEKCVVGLTRNLDTASGITPTGPKPDGCPTKPDTDRTLLDVVVNEVFPLELAHDRFDFFLCLLGTKALNGLVVHLSEGAATDSSAHREYLMLSKEVLLAGDGKTAIPREGLALIHGTALREKDFAGMKNSKVGLIWSPRSNDELYGSTTNVGAALRAGVDVALAPDWSPSGSAGMLQEMGYATRRYGITAGDVVAMATSVPAKLVRLSESIGALAPDKLADFVVLDVKVDPLKPDPLDPITKATPANVALVVVGGKPIYGDKELLKRVLPTGATVDAITVCGAEKAVYLADTEAGKRGWSLSGIEGALRKVLAKAGSSLPDIECD